MAKNSEIRVSSTEVPQYSIKWNDGWDWAKVVVESWTGGGSLLVNSSYGAYAYIWSSIGQSTFKDFLLSIDKGYFLSKIGQDHPSPVDIDETIKSMFFDTIQARRDGRLDKETARDFWSELNYLKEDGISSSELLAHRTMHLDGFDAIYGGDYPNMVKDTSKLDNFYNDVWLKVLDIFRKEKECQVPLTD